VSSGTSGDGSSRSTVYCARYHARMEIPGGLPARASKALVKLLGIVDTPNLEAGPLRTIARAADTRLVMHLWQHLPITNVQRRGWSAQLPPRTRPARNCVVWLDLVDDQSRTVLSKGGTAVFGAAAAGALEGFTIGRNETAHIPLYIQLPTAVRAFWVPGGWSVAAGTYLTSADFLYHGDQISSLRVPSGSYTIHVRIEHDDGQLEVPPIPLVVAEADRADGSAPTGSPGPGAR
jgi:hypothetical protein